MVPIQSNMSSTFTYRLNQALTKNVGPLVSILNFQAKPPQIKYIVSPIIRSQLVKRGLIEFMEVQRDHWNFFYGKLCRICTNANLHFELPRWRTVDCVLRQSFGFFAFQLPNGSIWKWGKPMTDPFCCHRVCSYPTHQCQVLCPKIQYFIIF